LSISKTKILYFVCAALFLAGSSLLPETVTGMLLAWCAVLLLCFGVKLAEQGLYKNFFSFGFIFGAVAYYWLPSTIHFFGGFPWPLAAIICFVFLIFSAIQFLFCAWLYKRFSRTQIAKFHLALPLAWLVSEFLIPRLFPWALSHTQIVWTSYASLAEFVGVYLLSALLLFWGQVVADLILNYENVNKRFIAVAFVISGLLICLGNYRTDAVKAQVSASSQLKVALIQGNLDAKDKNNLRLLEVNLDRYRMLSKAAVVQGAEMLIWPESVVNEWYPENIQSVAGSRFDPMPDIEMPLLFGALSYRYEPSTQREINGVKFKPTLKRFNSGIGIDVERNILGLYHKRVLMPFGEYIPFADSYPVLKELSPHTGDFQKGDKLAPIEFLISGQKLRRVAASVLICYEDLVPSLSIDAVRRGGNLLVNLTNDAWYGDTAAPKQHHLLAMWRAIETRRYLLRVTNTGFTAVVSPLGKTANSLPTFEPGILVADVALLEGDTIYSRIGDTPTWILVISLILYAVIFVRNPRRDTPN